MGTFQVDVFYVIFTSILIFVSRRIINRFCSFLKYMFGAESVWCPFIPFGRHIVRNLSLETFLYVFVEPNPIITSIIEIYLKVTVNKD